MKRILVFLFVLSIVIFLISVILSFFFIIKGFSVFYLLCGVLGTGAILLIYNNINSTIYVSKIRKFIKSCLIIVVTLFIFISLLGVKKITYNNERLYDLSIDNLLKYEVKLYEHYYFRSNAGCLCFKLNEYIYLKIPNTNYRVDVNHTLSENNNLILNYNAETKELIMKYKFNPDSEYTEQIARITE